MTLSIDGKASSKDDVIKQAVKLIAKRGVIKDVEVYQKGLFKSEEESTTGISEIVTNEVNLEDFI